MSGLVVVHARTRFAAGTNAAHPVSAASLSLSERFTTPRCGNVQPRGDNSRDFFGRFVTLRVNGSGDVLVGDIVRDCDTGHGTKAVYSLMLECWGLDA